MILEELGNMLQAEGIGSLAEPAPTLMFNGLTDLPDTQTSIWEYGGEAPHHIKNQKEAGLEYPRVQVVTRAKSLQAARDKAERIYRILDGFSGILGGVSYKRILALQQPSFMSRDDKGRFLIVANYRTIKEPSPLV